MSINNTNAGAPKGCVTHPSHNLYQSMFNKLIIISANDTTIQGFLQKDKEADYINEVNSFISWCVSIYLRPNAKNSVD